MDYHSMLIFSPGPVHLYNCRWLDLRPMHHRTDEFRSLVVETGEMVAEMLGTESPVYPLTTSGTGGMDAVMANITSPGSRVMVVAGGKFGHRWERIAREYRCETRTISFEPGEKVDLERVADEVDRFGAEYLAMVHVESSTGYLIRPDELISSLSSSNPVIIVDAIASAGVEELNMDQWGIDAVVCSSQKAFAAAPGLAFIALGDRGRELMKRNRRNLFYLSLDRYHRGLKEGNTPFTPPIQNLQMVHANLTRMKETGWRGIRERHRLISGCFRRAAEKLNLEQLPVRPSSAVQAFMVPEGCSSDDIVGRLYHQHGVIIAHGQGELRGTVIRTGFPGIHGYKFLKRVTTAMGNVLESLGVDVDIRAAEESLSDIEGLRELFD